MRNYRNKKITAIRRKTHLPKAHHRGDSNKGIDPYSQRGPQGRRRVSAAIPFCRALLRNPCIPRARVLMFDRSSL